MTDAPPPFYFLPRVYFLCHILLSLLFMCVPVCLYRSLFLNILTVVKLPRVIVSQAAYKTDLLLLLLF